jgi:anti-sigma factor RsiW
MIRLSFDQLVEIIRRRPLTPEEAIRLRDCLERDPSLRARWREESALTRLLRELSDAPLPSNFNSVVWAAAQGQPQAASLVQRIFARVRVPRVRLGYAACLLALLLGGFSYAQYASYNRARIASSVADITRGVDLAATATRLPPLDVLQDFDAIRRLGQVQPLADEELLAALQ